MLRITKKQIIDLIQDFLDYCSYKNLLTNEEKELLSYVEKVLGEEKYAELKVQAVKENQNLAQFMNLINMNTPSSVAYIVDPKTVDTLQVIDKSTKTPMILQRTITEYPLLNGWDFTKNYGKDVFYTGVDIRNTKGTAQSVESGLVLDGN